MMHLGSDSVSAFISAILAPQRKLEISYKCATFKDVVESDKPLFRLAEELARGWLVLPDRIINASMIEQIVEVKEETK